MGMVAYCLCQHPFQDARYGKGKRLFNKTRKQDGSIGRCTVCNREAPVFTKKAEQTNTSKQTKNKSKNEEQDKDNSKKSKNKKR